MRHRDDALAYFVSEMHQGHIEYRNGELWRLWELRRGWLTEPRRAEKRASNGYFMLRTNDKSVGCPLYVMAHRVIWAYLKGPIPDGMVVNHINSVRNDNRIENLEVVTQAGNLEHAKLAGRCRYAREKAVHRCKLTDQDVREIRALLATDRYLQKEIADMFGVRPNQISRIKTGARRGEIA